MITQEFYARIREVLLSEFNLDVSRESAQKSLSADILQMSNFYAEYASEATPWDEPWCQRAQLAYFLPLNVIRLRRVIREGKRVGFFKGFKSAIDFGAGLGAMDFAGLLESDANFEWRRPHEIEISDIARDLRHRLAPAFESSAEIPSQGSDLFMSSYALTELIDLSAEEFLERSANLMIIEPSTRADGRRLSEFRDQLIKAGGHAWAPCTHQQACPLILHSATDWCHDRVVIDGQHIEDVPWLKDLEKFLPIKNRTLTMSYLLVSKRAPPSLQGFARLTGDSLKEKGKTRQLFCRSSDREYLSWMHRHGEPAPYPRGELIQVPEGTMKSNELRTTEILSFFQKQ
jgi:hypothetical protein